MGRVPCCREALNMSVTKGRILRRNALKMSVGTGSRPHDLDLLPLMTLVISFCEHNSNSVSSAAAGGSDDWTGTLPVDWRTPSTFSLKNCKGHSP